MHLPVPDADTAQIDPGEDNGDQQRAEPWKPGPKGQRAGEIVAKGEGVDRHRQDIAEDQESGEARREPLLVQSLQKDEGAASGIEAHGEMGIAVG